MESKRHKQEAGIYQSINVQLVNPGDVITLDPGCMRGHGTYTHEGKLIATLSGVVERVNKLICVRPLKAKYLGEVGDVVVGRVAEIAPKRWKIEVNSRLNAVLMLSAVNLPGGALRRRSAEDELMMREYFREGDVISAEVQSIFSDGSLSLHTRSLKYGKLAQGVLCIAPSCLIKHCASHFQMLECGVEVIFGNNGYIWVSPPNPCRESAPLEGDEREHDLGFQKGDSGCEDGATVREKIARVKNCIDSLVQSFRSIDSESVMKVYYASLQYSLKEMLQPKIMQEISSF